MYVYVCVRLQTDLCVFPTGVNLSIREELYIMCFLPLKRLPWCKTLGGSSVNLLNEWKVQRLLLSGEHGQC